MGGSAPPPTTTQTTQTNLSPEQSQIFQSAFPFAKQYASTPLQQFQGTGIAGFDPMEALAQAQYKNQAAPTGAMLAGQAADSNKMLMDPKFMLDVANNPYLKASADAMTQRANQNLQETQLPGVRAGAMQAGGMYSGGSTRQGIAEGTAIGKTNQGLSNSIADMMFNSYNRGLSGMGEAIARNPSVQEQQLFAPNVNAAVGAQNRSMEQAKLDEEIRKFYTGQALPMIQAKELMSLIQGMPGGSTTSTATGSTPSLNPFMALLGGAGTGAGIGNLVMPGGSGALAGGGLGALLSMLMNRR